MLVNEKEVKANENGEILEEITKPCEITLIVEHHDKTDKYEAFDSFKMVDKENGGKLIDCHFKRDVNTTKLAAAGKKITAVFDYVNVNKNYEFPKCWCSGLHEDTIKKIF